MQNTIKINFARKWKFNVLCSERQRLFMQSTAYTVLFSYSLQIAVFPHLWTDKFYLEFALSLIQDNCSAVDLQIQHSVHAFGNRSYGHSRVWSGLTPLGLTVKASSAFYFTSLQIMSKVSAVKSVT